ncbi:MAG TPA: hypothetical protein VLW84_13820 [Terriglobales bacterium]|nr:hypothetical protein [Terriglobales bacterium]
MDFERPFVRSLLRPLALAGALAAAIVCLGCAEHHYYRVYDPYYHDYHRWDAAEVTYYNQWATETHHDPHRDFRTLNKDDQKDYWTWRHNHH